MEPLGNDARDAHPTISDVAEHAGVSRATASRALGKYGAVNPETLERIQASAAAIGYVPNELARAMRAGNTRTLGLIIAEIGLSIFDLAVRVVIDAARRQGYQVLVANTNEDVLAEREAVRLLLEKRVDGFILVPSSALDLGHLAPAALRGKPVTLLDRSLDTLALPSITGDSRRGVREAMSHFRDRGHERIGMVVTTANLRRASADRPLGLVSTIDDRVNSYFEYMADAQLAVDAGWVHYSGPDAASSRAAVRAVLDADVPPTALLASNSSMALAVIHVAKERGLTIGRELSLIGFDDAPWTTALTPPLTVIDLPVEEMAEAAVENLIAQIDSPAFTATSTTLDTRLLVRESVADLRAAPRSKESP